MKIILILLTIITSVIGQFFIKHGVTNSNLTFSLFSVLKIIFSPFVFFGLIFYALSAITWLFVLQKTPLSIAYPLLSFSYVFIVVLSVLFLKESMTINKIFGCLLILFGIFLMYK